MNNLKHYLSFLDPNTLLGALVIAAILIVVGLGLTWLTKRATFEALRHDRQLQIDEISLNFVGHLVSLGLWMVIATVYAHLIPALDRLATAMLAGVGLASVVIGFAAQQTLGNLVAGISLVLYRPFKQGDRLQITAPTPEECETGTVEAITLGYTKLRADDGREIIVSNGTMASQTMIKLTPVKPNTPYETGPKPPASTPS
jgi:small-conductance mechanosensitive channel